MACILQVAGTNFDVDAYVATSALWSHSIWRRGESRYPQTNPGGERRGTSGLRVLVSNAEFSDLALQIADAVEFLRRYDQAVRALTASEGVESAVLDFGAEISPPGFSSFVFPPELLSLAGEAGVGISLSVYPVDPE